MVAIFLKYPKRGAVKTRIAKEVGNKCATDIYRAFVEDITTNLASLSPTLHYAGCNLPTIKKWLPSFKYKLQSDGSLGKRLLFASKKHFEKSSEHLIIIGSDCLDITCQTIQEAKEVLKKYDVVIGPTKDGGYYLIGIRGDFPTIFKNITWGSEQVLQQTIKNIKKASLTYKLLDLKSDIDYWSQVPQKYKKVKYY